VHDGALIDYGAAGEPLRGLEAIPLDPMTNTRPGMDRHHGKVASTVQAPRGVGELGKIELSAPRGCAPARKAAHERGCKTQAYGLAPPRAPVRSMGGAENSRTWGRRSQPV
jgi:hypothetical protein